jgi:hypothetical protein
MTGQSSQLPWDALWARAEEIPWDAMTAFVDAVAVDMGVADELLKAYDESRQKPDDEACYMDLYVPAIFAMAAPKLSDEQRRWIERKSRAMPVWVRLGLSAGSSGLSTSTCWIGWAGNQREF